MRHAKDIMNVDTQVLAQARTAAVMQTVVPAITASDQVSVVLEPDEEEYRVSRQPLNLIALPMEDGPKSPRKAEMRLFW